ncbi:hypothetical protein K432DRAFT_397699 [Lepidopterella palustris CBS 459.81]|uniref:Uncharacterized protein n=1 Tax=Lepidopterella palustris CBS 459.81 TaxID=1314670 RepID=A0A8E2E042_9PEZI|nr:hypothetical protein K432DRAFT_397699 [Lepidopterella palustris CBS 459.81]
MSIAKAYVLAGKLDEIKFKNVLLDTFIERTATPVGSDLRYVDDNTRDGDWLRRFLVDDYAWFGKRDWIEAWARQDDVARKLVYDLSVALLDMYRNTLKNPQDNTTRSRSAKTQAETAKTTR